MTTCDNIVEGIYTNNFHIMDDFLPAATVEQLRECALQLADEKQFHAAKIGNRTATTNNRDIRRDNIFWLDESSENSAILTYLAAMKEISCAFNQQLFMGLVDFESHFAFYPPGAFYKKHIDQFHNTQDRKISSVYYLNPDWQASFGGELILYDKQDQLLEAIQPVSNRLVCFDSALPHEVNTTQKTRLSIAGWMKTRSLSR